MDSNYGTYGHAVGTDTGVAMCVCWCVGVSVDNVGMLSLLSSVLLTTQCMYDMGWLRTTLHARNI